MLWPSEEVNCNIYLSMPSRVREALWLLKRLAWRLEASAFTTDPEQWAMMYVDERMLGYWAEWIQACGGSSQT